MNRFEKRFLTWWDKRSAWKGITNGEAVMVHISVIVLMAVIVIAELLDK